MVYTNGIYVLATVIVVAVLATVIVVAAIAIAEISTVKVQKC